MIPVNLSKAWYNEKGVQPWQEIEKALGRPRRDLGLVHGIFALVSLIATATTAAIALTDSVQTVQYVDSLAKNVSMALETQEVIDRKLEDRLNALYDTVQLMGNEIQSLKFRSQLQCHTDYHWICVTPKQYNESQESWNRIKIHLQGIWNNENISLDLVQLHKEILDIENAPPT